MLVSQLDGAGKQQAVGHEVVFGHRGGSLRLASLAVYTESSSAWL
jgi:hypothetical protein